MHIITLYIGVFFLVESILFQNSKTFFQKLYFGHNFTPIHQEQLDQGRICGQMQDVSIGKEQLTWIRR